MSQRNRVLAVIFAVLFGVSLLVERPWEGDAHARTTASVRPLLPALQREVEIARVRIQPAQGRPAIHIEKVLDRGRPRWVVREAFDHPADVAKIGRLVESLRALETRDLESVNAESHAEYKLRDGEAIGVQVWSDQGEQLADLKIGGLRGQDVMSGSTPIVQFFVRTSEGPEVYRSNVVYLPPEVPARWCESRFLPLVTEDQVRYLQRTDHVGTESWRIVLDPDIPKVEVEDSGTEQALSGRWRMVMPESVLVPDFAGESWVFTMLGLEAAEVIGLANDAASEAQFGTLTDTFELGLEEGSFRIDLGDVLPNNRRTARVHGLPHLYALEDFDAQQLAQPVGEMLPKE
jgi:Domain of unknown function (DUF4340)